MSHDSKASTPRTHAPTTNRLAHVNSPAPPSTETAENGSEASRKTPASERRSSTARERHGRPMIPSFAPVESCGSWSTYPTTTHTPPTASGGSHLLHSAGSRAAPPVREASAAVGTGTRHLHDPFDVLGADPRVDRE